MKCKHNDCFTCPYPDCIIGERNIKVVDEERRKIQRVKNAERCREYYREHREEILAKKKENRRRKKGEQF